MIIRWIYHLLSKLGLGPGPKKMARQARKPTGFLGRRLAEMMNQSNGVLYDFVIPQMGLKSGDTVLEIGFGNGKTLHKLFTECPDIRVSGLDFSDTMVAEARRNATALIDEGKLSLHMGSSEKMPFPDNTFDSVFCINVLYFWDDPKIHFREVRRVLKPGGVFCPVIRTKESMLMVPFTQYGFQLKDADAWKVLLEQCGFAVAVEPFAEPPLDFNGQRIQLNSLCLKSTAPD